MVETLTNIMEQENHQCVLAVSHGGAIFMFLRKWVDESVVQRIPFINCCILKFYYEDGVFTYEDCMVEHLKQC